MGVLRIIDDGPVRRAVIDRPGTRNAIPPDGWVELTAALADFEASTQRVLVLTGEGGDFCSGADLGEAVDTGFGTPAQNVEWMRPVGEAATALHRVSKPTIAAVDGVAVGAGMNLALGCDIVIATDRVRFSEIFVRRGLTMDFGGTWLLPRIVGTAKARDIALTGRIVEAEEALAIGLVSRLVAPADLDTATTEVASQLMEGAPLAQRFLKVALDRSLDMTFEQAIAFETQTQALLLASKDVAEALAAFKEKRSADFRGA